MANALVLGVVPITMMAESVMFAAVVFVEALAIVVRVVVRIPVCAMGPIAKQTSLIVADMMFVAALINLERSENAGG